MRGTAVRRALVGGVALVAAVLAVALVPAPAMAMPLPGSGPLPPSAVSVVSPGSGVDPYPLPAHSGSGRRVVYSEKTMHVWAISSKGHVVREWKVSGLRDWPSAGTYRVFSKSLWSRSSIEDVGFRWMVRFAHGHTTNIGFHAIPYDSRGRPIQSTKQLGHPVHGGGCVRSADRDAHWLYDWAGLGTKVVVVD